MQGSPNYADWSIDAEIHKLAWDVFVACIEVAKRLTPYGAGQDLLSDAFAGTDRGEVAEMAFEERASKPVSCSWLTRPRPAGGACHCSKSTLIPSMPTGRDPAMRKGFEADSAFDRTVPTAISGRSSSFEENQGGNRVVVEG